MTKRRNSSLLATLGEFSFGTGTSTSTSTSCQLVYMCVFLCGGLRHAAATAAVHRMQQQRLFVRIATEAYHIYYAYHYYYYCYYLLYSSISCIQSYRFLLERFSATAFSYVLPLSLMLLLFQQHWTNNMTRSIRQDISTLASRVHTTTLMPLHAVRSPISVSSNFHIVYRIDVFWLSNRMKKKKKIIFKIYFNHMLPSGSSIDEQLEVGIENPALKWNCSSQYSIVLNCTLLKAIMKNCYSVTVT